MDYRKVYDSLMSSRLLLKATRYEKRKAGEYYEGHHILPKAKGGTGTSSKGLRHPNIVLLTAREHFIAHWLLWRIHGDRQSALAFHKMISSNKNQDRIVSSRGYQEARLAYSETNKGNQYGKGVVKVISEEQRRRHSDFMTGRFTGSTNAFYGKRHSEDTLLKMRKPKSESHKQRMSEAMKQRTKVTCTYCNKEVDTLNGKRWHFDKCKLYKN